MRLGRAGGREPLPETQTSLRVRTHCLCAGATGGLRDAGAAPAADGHALADAMSPLDVGTADAAGFVRLFEYTGEGDVRDERNFRCVAK